ncbi:MAG: UDP-N-acetylmuramoylalanyl-D-glutamate--2,6-diaminopimelate ligase [Treponema sp.]|nr:UDP-N-acetylmuramoylalanyl-D-glutamate--2,6-diaminopimelate ligase [Treponema sp.]
MSKIKNTLTINELQQGDLLFMMDSSDISKAITEIKQDSIYSHVGIYFDGLIYHATPKLGVNKQSLRSYLKEESKLVSVYRYADIDAQKVKTEAEKYIGLAYNAGFYPESEGLYCSQYITKLIPVFETIPMKFGDGVKEISDYWMKYYKELGTEIPLNQPGTNPYQLSLSKHLTFIGELEQF